VSWGSQKVDEGNVQIGLQPGRFFNLTVAEHAALRTPPTRSIDGTPSKKFAAGWEILLPHSMLTVERFRDFHNPATDAIEHSFKTGPAGLTADQPPDGYCGRETGGA
jgi:hypothetical protein